MADRPKMKSRGYSARKKVNLTFLMCLVWIGIFSNICSRALSESVTCDGIQCVEGSCVNGTCRCNYGWKGDNCDHCSGRVLLTDPVGFVTDGHGNYSVDNKCTWLLDTGQPNTTIQLKFHQFSTECGWDHVYVYDGDSVFSSLLAAYSGLIKQDSVAEANIPIITAKSGKAFIYFYSDAAYNMSGFNLSYSVNTCQKDCSTKGVCVDGRCQCQPGYSGDYCEVGPCPNNCTNGQCVQDKCQCTAGFIGMDCSTPAPNALWEKIAVPGLDIGLASAASTLLGDYIYIAGGYSFIPNPSFLSSYYPLTNNWQPLTPTGSVRPATRYGHTLVGYQDQLYMYGGVVGRDQPHVSRKMYIYNIRTNTWNVSSVEKERVIPVAVAGHTAHVINGIMYIIFGHSPIYGYKNRVQEYHLANKTWTIPRTSGAIIQGGYGHSSVYDPVSQIIYVYGGYHSDSHPNYQLTDQMYGFIPRQRKWIILRSNGSPRYLHSAAILSGSIFVFGGNTHNDTSISYGAKCYSSDLMVYNIECNSWYTLQSPSLPEFGARYGHSAVFYTLNDVPSMYIIGGFNGIMQNNLIKFTPGNCTFHKTKEACLAAKQGVQCVWVSNSYCSSKSDAILDGLSNSSEISKCDSDNGKEYVCPKFTSCPSCLSSAFNCQWCNNNCTAACPVKDKQSLVSDITQCQDNPALACRNLHTCRACESLQECHWGPSAKGGYSCRHISDQETPKDSDYSSETACEQPCYINTDCENCTRSSCMWCANKRRCVETNSYVASFIYGQCMEWTTSENRCAATRCADLLTCEKCQSNPMCGWCNDPSNTGIGKCTEGGAIGPGHNPIQANNTQCPADRWFFTQCPACQCNGHSTCNNETGACESCQGTTTGEHCESCLDGFYGDPTNGGKCSVCECNGQANTCDNKTGVCFCRTRGVVGDRCEKCDVPHKYYGDPRKGGTCFYDLVTDYQFTFNLSKRDDKYYTQINFMNIPSSSDRDVDFKVNCSDDKAFLNISVRTRSKSEVIFVESYSCNYFRDKFEHQDYSFGSSENTTFLVYVYNFQTPFWLQISFSQFPKIDLVHFFVTFFSCFLSLLIIAAVLYKIKHKYDNYRRRQRMIVEMEEMASRPFSTVTLEIERKIDNYVAEKKDLNLDLRKRKKINNKPSQVAIEPLITQKAAVLTLLVQLPTGHEDWTPSGSSGVAIASALVTLGHHRKQSVEHGGKGDKNRFKKHSVQTHSDTCV
ncbi:attractin-like isoform X3 [Mizuhopecten yessoensis]|uniref:attractin-like isoform X3 n=1 Tax=Mizuhopecten yessoensis TaxID=6573 RepID=UPI000B45F520|nr:attractin-like isoform X3 [Mizuhopecten yessoensis]